MSYTWTDIANSEAASSVRTKLNGLGAEAATLDTNITSVNSNISTINTNIKTLQTTKGNTNCLIYSNVSINYSSWVSSSTYSGYSYQLSIPCSGMTSDYVPFVTFNVSDAQSGSLAPVALSGNNTVTIYSAAMVTTTIPSIIAWKVAS